MKKNDFSGKFQCSNSPPPLYLQPFYRDTIKLIHSLVFFFNNIYSAFFPFGMLAEVDGNLEK